MKMDMPAKASAPGESKEPHDYEIEDAANTLMKAEEIKKNKKLMPHVHKHLQKKAKAISSVQGLRDHIKSMQDEESQESEAE